MAADPGEVRHLLRRATFAAGYDAVDRAVRAGYTATVTGLLQPTGIDAGAARTPMPDLPIPPRPKAAKGSAQLKAYRKTLHGQTRPAVAWWVDRMAQADAAFVEKLTFAWHGHWATSVQKVKFTTLMLRQNDTLRRLGRGSFRNLAQAMIGDPALLLWLDGEKNKKQAPNENLSREFMELFTLGHGDYTETDVRQAARALTGWRVSRKTGASVFDPAEFDDGEKAILGRTGNFDATGFVDLVISQPASPRYLATRMWRRFASPAPPPAASLQRMVTAYGTAHDITAMMRALFLDPAFRATSARSTLVKQPTEWLVGTMRTFGLRVSDLKPADLKPADTKPAAKDPATALAAALAALGQVPFFPPSVGGWPSGVAWLSTAATPARIGLARRIAAVADLDPISSVRASSRLDALAATLGVDRWSDRTAAVLSESITKPPELVVLGLISPEYVVC